MMNDKLKVGICGLGTVGGGVFNLLHANAAQITARTDYEIQVVQVATRQLPADFINHHNAEYVNDIFAVASNPAVDVVVELIGGINPALELVLTAINNGKHVVTANKALLAHHGDKIFQVAQNKGVIVAFEAAVAGAIPIIKTVREGLAANNINLVAGIINGTGNFILTGMMQQHLSFAEALSAAQRLGYAEADPTFDVEGIDAAHKLTILAALAFGMRLRFDAVYSEGIANISRYDIDHAAGLGYIIKHLGIAKKLADGMELRVHPTLVSHEQLLSKVDGVMNAVLVNSDAAGNTLYYGAGAGAAPTASAVIADIIDIARANIKTPFLGNHHLLDLPVIGIEESISPYYLRIMADDIPGVLAQITGVFSQNGINIETIVQKESEEQAGIIPIIIITHPVREKIMNAAIWSLEQQANIKKKVVKIRILDLAN